MKKNYFTIALVFCFAFMGVAQNTVTVDASAEQLGYEMNVPEGVGEIQDE